MSQGMTAKVIVQSKHESGVGDDRQVRVQFTADYNDGRNKEWSRWTPTADVNITLKGDLADRYNIGEP